MTEQAEVEQAEVERAVVEQAEVEHGGALRADDPVEASRPTGEAESEPRPEAEAPPQAGAEAPPQAEAEALPQAEALPGTADGLAEASAPEAIGAAPTEAGPEAEPTEAAPEAEEPVEGAAGEPAAPVEPATPATPETPADQPTGAEPSPAKPGPRARPRPARGPKPASRPVVAARPPSDPTPWGRMDTDGVVYLRTRTGERAVGTVVDATEEAALAHFGREFDAVVAQVDLQEQRLLAGGVAPAEVIGSLRGLRAGLADASVVGDVAALSQRMADLEEMAAQRRAEADASRAAAREQALAERTALVEEAEKISGTDLAKMQWRPAGDRLRELLDAWKHAQHSAKLDKKTEDELWKRFSAARTSFDKARRAHFSTLEATNAQARATKEQLVARAEAASTSTDWAATSTTYRELMDAWKAAGRTSRKEDDALWARFRAAQDVFFDARGAANAAENEEFTANLAVKEQLLTEAEALLPVKDPRAARAALRDIAERWEAAGKVPRADMQRIERRLRAVESAVNDSDREKWRKSNPETRARAQGAVEQLERAVAALEADLAAARQRGDTAAVNQATSALSARREWLAAARRTAEEFAG